MALWELDRTIVPMGKGSLGVPSLGRMTDDSQSEENLSTVMILAGELLRVSKSRGAVAMQNPVLRIAGSLMLLVVAMGSVPSSVLALPPVQGEVISLTTGVPGTMVIRDDKGQLHILNLTPQTQLGARFKVGDKVLAFFSPYGVSAVQLQGANR